jgi:hypothetical protein
VSLSSEPSETFCGSKNEEDEDSGLVLAFPANFPRFFQCKIRSAFLTDKLTFFVYHLNVSIFFKSLAFNP